MKKIVVLLIMFCNYSLWGFIENSSFYGYSQLDYSISNKIQDNAKFEINRVNIVGEFQLSPQIRFITDIELEHNTNIDKQGSIGSIKFSQVWAEYSIMPEIKLRAGKILTNFGLYNKIHDASPTFFAIAPPLVYSRHAPNADFKRPQRYFGKYIMGTEMTGTIDVSESGSQFEYSLMFGNGRNDFVDGTYIDKNTAYSGRVLYRPGSLFGLQIGTSFYTDINEIGMGGLADSRELTYGLEFEYDWQNIQVQSEFYVAQFKDLTNNDQKSILGYLQFAYTIDDVLTPYLQLNLMKYDDTKSDLSGLAVLGLNHPLSNNFFVKLEAQYNYFSVESVVLDYGTLKASLSIAF